MLKVDTKGGIFSSYFDEKLLEFFLWGFPTFQTTPKPSDLSRNAEKNKEITEDDSRKGQDEIQKITDGYVSQIEEIISIKEKEILEI